MSDDPPAPAPVPVELDRYGRDLSGFTPRERLFVAEYPVDWNATQAAIRAGYSKKSAKDIGHELTRKPKIIDAITAFLAKREDRASIDRKWVLARLVDVEAEAAKVADDKDATGKAAARLHRLRALELIGKHVDVNAFRTQLGISGPDGSPLWDLSRLNDEELDTFERLLAKISVIGSDQIREIDASTTSGEGED
jgi:phage terminase small subunit